MHGFLSSSRSPFSPLSPLSPPSPSFPFRRFLFPFPPPPPPPPPHPPHSGVTRHRPSAKRALFDMKSRVPAALAAVPCDLEVQVNSQHTFHLNLKMMVSYCGHLAKRLSAAAGSGCHCLALHDFPGGPDAFETAARFCYNGGRSCPAITATNVALLRCVAEYLEMSEEMQPGNLILRTEAFLSGMPQWCFEDTMLVLKSCQPLFPLAEETGVVQRCVEALAQKAASGYSSTGFIPSSSEESNPNPNPFRNPNPNPNPFRSPNPNTSPISKQQRWPGDMSPLSIYLMEKLVKAMAACNVDNRLLAKSLLHYLQASLPCRTIFVPSKECNPDEEILRNYVQKVQKEVLETVVGLLYSLERASASCRALLGIRRVALLANVSKACLRQLEEMIGSQLDEASLDNLLAPSASSPNSPPCCAYDVDFILRLVRNFLKDHANSTPAAFGQHMPLKTVGTLIDLFLVEIAPDPNLKATKFLYLAEVLPDHARDSHDDLYRALDIYLEAHPGLTNEDVMDLFKVINFCKLSFEACHHMTQNPRLPMRLTIKVLVVHQESLKAAYMNNGGGGSGLSTWPWPSCNNSPLTRNEGNTQIIDYSSSAEDRNTDSVLKENHELKEDLDSLQSRVTSLEKLCTLMKSQLSKNLSRLKLATH